MATYLGEKILTDLKDTDFAGHGAEAWALEHVGRYGGHDGDHHKQWVLDQVVRILCGTPVGVREASWDDGLVEHRFETGEPTDAYRAWVADWVAGKTPVVGKGASRAEFVLAFVAIHGQPAASLHPRSRRTCARRRRPPRAGSSRRSPSTRHGCSTRSP